MSANSTNRAPLRVGVVGCGMMAGGMHIPNVASNPQMELHWLCDLDENRARELADQYGAHHTSANYLDVLDDPRTDLVILATTHALRGEFIVEAAKRNKPVFVEKPMGGSPREVGQILQAVRESGIPFCVCHNRRSAPAVKDALGILERLRANPSIVPWRFDRNSHLRPPMPEEQQTMVLVRVNDDVLSWKPWAFEDGALINEMTHFVDLADCFMGTLEPRRVYAQGSSRMNFTLIVEYEDGSLATLTHSAVGTLDYPKELVEITCHGAMLAIDHMMELRVMGIEGEPFRRTYPTLDARATTEKQGVEAFYESALQTIDERLRTGEMSTFIGTPNKGHYAHLDQFANCVRGEDVSPCDVSAGARITMLTLKLLESCRLGMPLRFGVEEYQILKLRE